MVVAEIKEAGGTAEFLAADLSALAEVRRLAEALQQRTDRLDILINNAGIGTGGSGAPRQRSADEQAYDAKARRRLKAISLELTSLSSTATVKALRNQELAIAEQAECAYEHFVDQWRQKPAKRRMRSAPVAGSP
jgi:NAD(P)-dependent dehydrogenase (short-subunit alcohol dehydrogenase family)